ncbi:hypothetical protein AURDEDRAFT_129994 [Auricularia subglabra TFB-10046 SS5]|uniref:Uncharacterized protein n=1 Tax=Auricularia subglabra (strain TFB-10046 / SS5) TaxID=717982 RepID=J0WT97_AURST|nr:hypothetical protein AURDEDRAFT_129994 [Auricularia subglabra TFB-10046 SS5]
MSTTLARGGKIGCPEGEKAITSTSSEAPMTLRKLAHNYKTLNIQFEERGCVRSLRCGAVVYGIVPGNKHRQGSKGGQRACESCLHNATIPQTAKGIRARIGSIERDPQWHQCTRRNHRDHRANVWMTSESFHQAGA